MIYRHCQLPAVSVGPDVSTTWIVGAIVVGLIVLAAVAWRKGWLGPENEAKIKAKRDALNLKIQALERKLEAFALSKMPVSAGTASLNTAAGIAELKDMLARGVITQAQYDDSMKKLMGV